MGGGFFHRNEKFQKTKVIYFMLGTSSLMGGSKIQILHFIIIPYCDQWDDLTHLVNLEQHSQDHLLTYDSMDFQTFPKT